MFAIASAALIGGLPTIALLWPQGAPVALLCAPLGGSAAGLTMAVAIAAARYAAHRARGGIARGRRMRARRGGYAYAPLTPQR